MTLYLFHQGTENNRYYSLHVREPRVTVRQVRSDITGEMIPLYETPDTFIFNFCLYGMERRLKVALPLGSVTKMRIQFGAGE